MNLTAGERSDRLRTRDFHLPRPYAVEGYDRANLGIPTYRARYMADWDNVRLYDPPIAVLTTELRST